MPQGMTASDPIPAAEAVLAGAQHRFACWSRAWTQMAHGMMTAGIAQTELARTMLAVDPGQWGQGVRAGASGEDARQWLQSTEQKFHEAVLGYRKVNDELARSVFRAAASLIDGIGQAG